MLAISILSKPMEDIERPRHPPRRPRRRSCRARRRAGSTSHSPRVHEIGERRDDGGSQPVPRARGRRRFGSRVSSTLAMPTTTSARHHRIGAAPAEEAGEIERARARREHADAIADLRRRGAGALLALGQQFDAVGVDDDVLARRQERDHARRSWPRASAIDAPGSAAPAPGSPAPAGSESTSPSRAAGRARASTSGSGTRSIAGAHRNFRL